MSITFKEYINSKQVLLDAAKEPAQKITKHSLNKYCKIPKALDESSNEKEELALKPTDDLTVFWEGGEQDTIKKVIVRNIKSDLTETFKPYWSNQKMKTWLDKNTD